MKVSSRVDYALSCAIRVAERYGSNEPVNVRQIAGKEKLAMDYVEQLLVTMKRAGILKSVRGKGGGYVLAVSPDKISAKDIVEAVDKNILEPVCFRKKGRQNKCCHSYDCKIRGFWVGLKDKMEDFMDDYTLEKLLILRKKERRA
jgi:Rrf2 family transcriptional regulator, iron-sulfur cluster assembly transcription factor